MPLIKRGSPEKPAAAKPAEAGIAPHLSALASPDADIRWHAARALGGHTEAVPALASALTGELSPRVREAMMTALMRTGDAASVTALLPYLRSQDAGVRSSAIEALQALPGTVQPFMALLLQDADTDVRILACELARNLPAEDATQILCALLEREPHANVCASAIDVLAELGTASAVPALEAVSHRFATTPFLPFAASVAIARITGAES